MIEQIKPYIEKYAPTVVYALVTLVVGWYVIKIVESLIRRTLDKRDFDPSLKTFLASLMGIILKVLLFISVIGMLGVKTTSFVAIIGAAGLAVALAFQGTLSNFAGSVLILFFKPFKVGDVIDVSGKVGTVKEIQIFCTVLKTLDNKTVIVPNGSLATGTIVNLSTEEVRRIDLVFGCGYDDDIRKVRKILEEIVNSDERVLKDPAPQVVVGELADSSVNFFVRPWAKTENYWPLYFDLIERVKLRFDDEGISIPYPQRDVHLYQQDKNT